MKKHPGKSFGASPPSDYFPTWPIEARTEFHDYHEIKLRIYGKKRGVRAGDLKDFVADVRVKIVVNQKAYDPNRTGSVWPWVYGTARNTLREWARDINKQGCIKNSARSKLQAFDSEDADRREANHELLEQLRVQTIQSLMQTKMDRETLKVGSYAFFHPQEKPRAIAEKFGVTAKFVHSAKHKVKRFLETNIIDK